MRRMWPEEYNSLLEGAEVVELKLPTTDSEHPSQGSHSTRKALRARISQQDFEAIWPLAEARYRLTGARTGEAITLIANNPHYKQWHPADGGADDETSASGQKYSTKFMVVHFLLDDVRENAAA